MTTPNARPHLHLYGTWRSSATWRVRIALAQKGLDWAYTPIHLKNGGGQQFTEAYDRINPMHQVPVLEVEDGGETLRLAQSLVIVDYLDERFPQKPMLPQGRGARAKARQIAEMINSGIQPLQNTIVQNYVRDTLKADDAAWVQHWVSRGLEAVERVLVTTAGTYAVGDDVTVADACIVPELYFARRFNIDLAAFPTLVRVDAACAALPAFEKAHARAQLDAEP